MKAAQKKTVNRFSFVNAKLAEMGANTVLEIQFLYFAAKTFFLGSIKDSVVQKSTGLRGFFVVVVMVLMKANAVIVTSIPFVQRSLLFSFLSPPASSEN